MALEPAKIRSRQRLTLWGTVLITAVLTVAQLAFYLTGYEFDTGLYVQGALPTVTAILWIAAAAGAILLSLPLPDKETFDPLHVRPTAFTDFASLLSVASLAGFLGLVLFWQNDSSDPLGGLLNSITPTDNTARTMLQLSMLLAIPAAIHFIFQFAYHKVNPLGASAAMLWCCFTALRVYFDMRHLLMSPGRILHLVAFVAAILFFIAELRLARGIATRRFYSACASLALICAGCDGIAGLTLAGMGWLEPGSEITSYCFLLSVALYAMARLFALCKEAAPKPAPETASPETTFPEAVTADIDEKASTPLPAEAEGETPLDESPEKSPDDSPVLGAAPEKSPDDSEEKSE